MAMVDFNGPIFKLRETTEKDQNNNNNNNNKKPCNEKWERLEKIIALCTGWDYKIMQSSSSLYSFIIRTSPQTNV